MHSVTTHDAAKHKVPSPNPLRGLQNWLAGKQLSYRIIVFVADRAKMSSAEAPEPVDCKQAIEDSCKPKCMTQWKDYEACAKRIEHHNTGDHNCSAWFMDFQKCIDKCVWLTIAYVARCAAWSLIWPCSGAGTGCPADICSSQVSAACAALRLSRSLLSCSWSASLMGLVVISMHIYCCTSALSCPQHDFD